MTPSEDHRAVAARMYENFTSGDGDALVADLDPAVAWTDPPELPGAATHEGREAVRALMEALRDPWEECGMEPREYTERGDRLMVRVHFWGKGRESGLEMNTEFFQVGEYRDGLVLRSRSYFDEQDALEVLERGD